MMMRTTVTLDADVAAKLAQETRKTGRTFKDVLNEVVREGFARRSRAVTESDAIALSEKASWSSELRPGLSWDMKIEDMLDIAEGPSRR